MRFLRLAKCLLLPFVFVFLIFPLTYRFALAPVGDKHALGGRTIASVQEEEFDLRLERLRFCYGVRLQAHDVSIDRRRACKAIVVNKLRQILGQRGVYLVQPLHIDCQDRSNGQAEWREWDGTPVLALKPNNEREMIDRIKEKYLVESEISAEKQQNADAACERILHCQKLVQWSAMAPIKAASCVLDRDAGRRRIIMDLIADQMFHFSSEHPAVMTQLLSDP